MMRGHTELEKQSVLSYNNYQYIRNFGARFLGRMTMLMPLPFRLATPSTYIIYVMLLLSWGCANVVTPSGGEKDITPPIPISYMPDSAATGFDSKEIRIQFDEYIQLNDVFNQVIVSPPLTHQPKFKLKGKTLIISISDTLKVNTTYTINFGQAIKDLTEGNILDNFTYVFSTGAVLDSLQMSGVVTDAITTKPLEKIYVVVYQDAIDSAFTTTRPYYFARTDKNGNWSIKNMRAGNYSVFALEDMNFNYYYDLPNERIAFVDSLLPLNANISGIQLQVFSENKMQAQLQDYKSPRYGLSRITFTTPVQNPSITYLGTDTSASYIYKNPTGDSIYFWKSNYALDSHQLRIAFDTTIIAKTIAIKTLPQDTVFSRQKNTFTHNANALSKSSKAPAEWDPEREIQLKFYNPIRSVNQSLPVFRDSVPDGQMTVRIDSLDPRNVYLLYPYTTDKLYDIHIPAGSFTDIFGLSNTADTISLRIRKEDAYSTLTLLLENKTNAPLIIALTKFDGTTLKTWNIPVSDSTSAPVSIKQKYIFPGVYRIYAIVDADANNAFTTGNLATRKQPERTIYYKTDQNLRANWENEIEWVIE